MLLSGKTALGATWAVVCSVLAFAPLAVSQQTVATVATPVFRASELIGVNVRNADGEDVGEINDVVVNAANGRAAYVALSVGGVAGVGDELFAVPFDAFTFVADDKDERAVTADGDLDNVVAVLPISKTILDEAQGFNQDNWPDFADPTWRTANDRVYQAVPRRNRMTADDGLTGDLVRVSELIGLNVENGADENVGEINDVVIDNDTGHVRYAALSVGGFLGMGDKLFAIPLKAFTIAKDDAGDLAATLAVTKESFDNVTGFDQDAWPNMSDRTWRDQNDRAYQAWRPLAR